MNLKQSKKRGFKVNPKKIISSLVVAGLLTATLATSVFAADSDWRVKPNYSSNGISTFALVEGYTGTDIDVTMPSMHNALPVTTIWKSACYGKNFINVTLPTKVSEIQESAFQSNNLSSLTPPSTLKTLGKNAFANNKIATIGTNSFSTIEEGAFSNNKLTSIDLPLAASLGVSAFANNLITDINIPNIYNLPKYVFAHNKLTSYTVPEKIVNIGAGAFNDNLLPDDQAFFYNKSDTERIVSYGGAKRANVVIPIEAKKLGDYSFAENSLTSVKITENVHTIEQYAFSSNNLKIVEIPENVVSIGQWAFKDNPDLTTIYMKGRTNTTGMVLGAGWNGSATIVFGSAPETPDPTPDPDPTPTPPGGGSSNITVTGAVEAITTLDIDVPLNTTFIINEARDFISAEFAITNNSPVPVVVTATSISATGETPAKVVEPDVYTDDEWKNLSKSETQSKIALGLKSSGTAITRASDTVKWFGGDGIQSNIVLGTLNANVGGTAPKMNLRFDAKYGNSWGGDIADLKYDMVLTFSIV